MLACLKDPKFGAVSPPIHVEISKDRIDRNLVNAWEVAGTRLAYRGPGSGTAIHVAAECNWIICGATGVYRACILKDQKFLEGFTNDYWWWRKLDVGDDTFISRWLLKHGKSLHHEWFVYNIAIEGIKTCTDLKVFSSLDHCNSMVRRNNGLETSQKKLLHWSTKCSAGNDPPSKASFKPYAKFLKFGTKYLPDLPLYPR